MQDCGHPYYLENYIAFYAAIKSRYPNIQTIANCNLDGHAPTEIWDWYDLTLSAMTSQLGTSSLCCSCV